MKNLSLGSEAMDEVVYVGLNQIKRVLHVETHAFEKDPGVEKEEGGAEKFELGEEGAAVRAFHLMVPELLL